MVITSFVSQGCNGKNNENSSEVDAFVENLISEMTLEEKIGQMTQVDQRYLNDPDDIRKYFLGSLLSGGGSTPPENNPPAWAEMYDGYQQNALSTRLQIPLIYGIDAVHGHNNVLGATIFPHNIGLGCTNNPDLVREVARATAVEVAATGIDWTFAPCVAVPQDIRWGRTYEGFSEDPDIVAELSGASVEGFQSSSLGNSTSILACAKHYIGDGGTTWGTGLDDKIDRGDTQLSEAELREIHLPGYLTALEAGVGSVMASFNSWNGEKLHGHRYLLTDLLKNELSFKGFVVSDWAGIDDIPGDYKNDIANSINAGMDMVMVPGMPEGHSFAEFQQLLKEAVEEELVAQERIDDAVKRILTIKYEMGLFDKPFSDRSLLSQVGSEEHKEIARQAVRESSVLLKNDELLPLSKNIAKIHVSGKRANDVGAQCGGWTISWQGDNGDITPGTTVLKAIQNSVSSSTEVTYSVDGSNSEGATAAVVVIGEDPYAEMHGDKGTLDLDPDDIAALQRINSAGVPMVVVMLSGRPLIIDDYIKDWSGFIAAWLPGTEAAGITDIIFGDYSPTGKLSYSWPKKTSQLPFNSRTENYDPLLPLGFGLSY